MRDIAYYNGKIGRIDEVQAPITDRGFYFGDGDIPGMKIGNAYRVPKINVIRYALSAGNPQPAA